MTTRDRMFDWLSSSRRAYGVSTVDLAGAGTTEERYVTAMSTRTPDLAGWTTDQLYDRAVVIAVDDDGDTDEFTDLCRTLNERGRADLVRLVGQKMNAHYREDGDRDPAVEAIGDVLAGARSALLAWQGVQRDAQVLYVALGVQRSLDEAQDFLDHVREDGLPADLIMVEDEDGLRSFQSDTWDAEPPQPLTDDDRRDIARQLDDAELAAMPRIMIEEQARRIAEKERG